MLLVASMLSPALGRVDFAAKKRPNALFRVPVGFAYADGRQKALLAESVEEAWGLSSFDLERRENLFACKQFGHIRGEFDMSTGHNRASEKRQRRTSGYVVSSWQPACPIGPMGWIAAPATIRPEMLRPKSVSHPPGQPTNFNLHDYEITALTRICQQQNAKKIPPHSGST